MAALDELGGKFAAFYTSVDMKNWTEQSRLSGYDECMELFALPVDGDNKNTRWVLFAGDARYTIGSFDGKTFTPEHPGKRQVHWGCYYASQTFDNAPNGRKIQMGWVRRGFGKPPWDQLFSFPHQLTLHKTEDSIRMFAKPVDEIEKLRAKSNKADAQDLVADRPVNLPVGSDLLDVRLTVDVGNAKEIVLNLPGRQIVYSVTEQRFKGIPSDDRTGEPEIGQMKPVNGKIDIQVLADRGLTEIIGNHGRVFITTSGPPKQNAPNISFEARGGGAKLITLEAHELKSIWDKLISTPTH
jgi:sucrose-6-phosphate hydrolase SacC (GH32 family)